MLKIFKDIFKGIYNVLKFYLKTIKLLFDWKILLCILINLINTVIVVFVLGYCFIYLTSMYFNWLDMAEAWYAYIFEYSLWGILIIFFIAGIYFTFSSLGLMVISFPILDYISQRTEFKINGVVETRDRH